MQKTVTIVDYGRSNLLSVQRAVQHCGGGVRFATTCAEIANAERLILPGVGAFADGMQQLTQKGLAAAIRQKAADGAPLLGICLGMQLLFGHSTEGGLCDGLALLAGSVQPLPATATDNTTLRVPHTGWNLLLPADGRTNFCGSLLAGVTPLEEVYFVHSYAAHPQCEGDRLADTIYGGHRVCAAVQHGQVMGTQFHPEKSGDVGLAILQQFLQC